MTQKREARGQRKFFSRNEANFIRPIKGGGRTTADPEPNSVDQAIAKRHDGMIAATLRAGPD